MKHILYKYITVAFLIFQLFPPIWLYIPINESSVLAIFVVITIVLFPDLLGSKSMIFLLMYTLITFIKFLNGNAFFTPINNVVVPFLNVSSALLIATYAFKYPNISYIKTTIITTFVLLTIMTIISIPQLIVYPNIIRGASVSAARFDNVIVYYWVIGYGTIHGLVAIFAPLVFLLKKTFRKNKWTFLLWGIETVLLFYIVFAANATMALLISTLAIIAGLIINFTNFTLNNVTKLVLFGVICLLLFNKTTIYSLLDIMQPHFSESSSNYVKITEMKDYLTYGYTYGDLGARESLYKRSSSLFWESPFLGTTKPEQISLHSYILDRLAALGIILFIPLFLTFVSHIKFVYKNLNQTKVIYVISCCCYLLMLFLKNDFGTGTFLFAFSILPILCLYIENILFKQHQKNDISRNS